MRKVVSCTEEMYVRCKCDRWAYIYVNGHLLRNANGGGAHIGRDFENGFLGGPRRVPSRFLHPSGQQVVTVHVQARLRDNTDGIPRALYADASVQGIFNPQHVVV